MSELTERYKYNSGGSEREYKRDHDHTYQTHAGRRGRELARAEPLRGIHRELRRRVLDLDRDLALLRERLERVEERLITCAIQRERLVLEAGPVQRAHAVVAPHLRRHRRDVHRAHRPRRRARLRRLKHDVLRSELPTSR